MKTSLVEKLNLELAWKRVKSDFSNNRIFVEIPHELNLFEANADSRIKALKEKIESENYSPKQSIICEIPKKGGSIRPAAYLEIEDRIVYSACVGACYESIFNFINDEIGNIDSSNTIYKDSTKIEWISPSFSAWDNFRKKSLEQIKNFAEYVVITDVSACFENIDIKSLIDDLREIGCDNKVLDLLSKCLNTWAKLEGRGIPQGYGASDILGKFYLSQVDKFMKPQFEILRFVDDIRIFCASKIEAKKALMCLVKYLGMRGLNIQTSKTGIYQIKEAKELIEAVQPIIKKIKTKYEEELGEEIGNPYVDLFYFEKNIARKPEDIPLDVIKFAFDGNFKQGENDDFNKTLFRFLVKRFIRAKSTYAIKFCLFAFEEHPEETGTILNYFEKAQFHKNSEVFTSIIHFITNFINSERAIYHYQNYLLIQYLIKINFKPSQILLNKVRRIVFEEKSPIFLECIGLHFLGKYGDSTDYEIIEFSFTNYHQTSQLEAIFTLKNMDKSKRNRFFSRISTNGILFKDAVTLAKMQ